MWFCPKRSSERNANDKGGEIIQDIKEEALVSVIIPVYHVEQWLPECIESVIHQTYNNLEIIMIDDGSMDSCGAICDEYAEKDSRIQVLHQENGGAGHARNVGMDLAHGKYIIFLDSDDYWQPETVEQLYLIAEREQVQVIAFAANTQLTENEPFHCIDYHHTVQNGEVKRGTDSLKTALKYHEYHTSPCMRFYLLGYLRENNLRFDQGVIHEDESFSFLSYLCADRVECIGERFYIRRYRPGSVMMTLDPVRSSNGYRTAMETVFRFTQRAGVTEDAIRLCTNRMIEYAFEIFSLYRKQRRQSRYGRRNTSSSEYLNASEIAVPASETFRTISRTGKNLPLWFRATLSNFWSGYTRWLCWRCARKFSCFFSGQEKKSRIRG